MFKISNVSTDTFISSPRIGNFITPASMRGYEMEAKPQCSRPRVHDLVMFYISKITLSPPVLMILSRLSVDLSWIFLNVITFPAWIDDFTILRTLSVDIPSALIDKLPPDFTSRMMLSVDLLIITPLSCEHNIDIIVAMVLFQVLLSSAHPQKRSSRTLTHSSGDFSIIKFFSPKQKKNVSTSRRK